MPGTDPSSAPAASPSPAAPAGPAAAEPGARAAAAPGAPAAAAPGAPAARDTAELGAVGPDAAGPGGTGAQTPAPQLTAGPAERAARSPRDVALSLAALLIPILLLVGAYKVFWHGDAPIKIDVSETYATARHAGAFPVLEPQPLPAGWSANAASYTPTPNPTDSAAKLGAVLRVVYHAPGGAGVQLVQSSGTPDAVLSQELGATAKPGNLVTIGDQEWRVYPQLPAGGQALVNVVDGRTVIIFGDADTGRLRELAATLR